MNDRDRLRQEHLQDGAGFTPERAHEAVTGNRANMGGAALRGANREPQGHGRGPDRRGGRSYPSPSDSERDPYFNVGQKPVGDAQVEINHQGAALVRAVGEFVQRPDIKRLSGDAKQKAIDEFINKHSR